jgi:predicted ArsR family transcriptional regulator
MLFTPSRTEERVYQLVRQRGSLSATAEEIAREVGGDAHDARLALDELVARNELRRFERPGERPVYWS